MEESLIFNKGRKMNYNHFYEGQNCLIYGVNSFVGKTIGKYLAQKHVNLGLIDLDSRQDSGIVDYFKEQNKLMYRTVISGNRDSFKKAVEDIHRYFGDFNYLICTYYIDEARDKINPEDFSLETWNNLFQDWIVNYFLILKAVIPLMIEAKGGRVVFFNTTTGYTGEGEGEGQITLDGSIHESACSSAITGMMTSIAADIIPQGVSVNGIALGPDYKSDPERIIWAVNLWLSGIGNYSCGQIVRLY
jgi:NAD(P)-dependent dehydrogenase (short-subunit alcohol dehydrogenase family)